VTLHIVVAGVDGSGKSTLTKRLALAVTAEHAVSCARVGDDVAAWSDAEDHVQPGFVPSRLPLAAKLSLGLRRLAKRWARGRHRYPLVKLAQLWAQDRAAYRLAERHNLDVVVRDGETWLCAHGRGGNYLTPASTGHRSRALALARMLLAPFLAWFFARRRVPDVVFFLDLSPERALDRIGARGARPDAHENLADLEQAQRAYLHALGTMISRGARVVLLDATQPPQALVAEALGQLDRHLPEPAPGREGQLVRPAPKLLRSVIRRMLRPSYLALLLRDRSSRRELLFPFSRAGRTVMRDGYSAEVMRLIYQAEARTLPERAFHHHPLHQAVAARLPRVQQAIVDAIDARQGPIRILTGPSGTLEDIDAALQRCGRDGRAITLWSVDLDPVTADHARRVAGRHGIAHEHLTASLTDDATRERLRRAGPFDLVVFVGLSSWLPKRELLAHLRLCRQLLDARGGQLVTDAFAPAPYATSGRIGGFSASYYDRDSFATMLAFAELTVDEGASRDGGRAPLNRVVVARPVGAPA